MAYSLDALAAYQRRRWMQPNAHLYMRPDAHRFIRSDAARSMPNADRWRHPDEKLWNLHAAHQRRAKFAPEMGQRQPLAAELARLQAQHDALRGRFIAWKGELARTRALERAEAKRLKRRSDAAWDKFIAALSGTGTLAARRCTPRIMIPTSRACPPGIPTAVSGRAMAPKRCPRQEAQTIRASCRTQRPTTTGFRARVMRRTIPHDSVRREVALRLANRQQSRQNGRRLLRNEAISLKPLPNGWQQPSD